MKNLIKYLKSTKGQSLAEFAVTTAMMATLATTAAPKFSGVGEGAKEKKTLADIDKIVKSSNNFYNAKVTSDGRGRFPGQAKYNAPVPDNSMEYVVSTDDGVDVAASEQLLIAAVKLFTTYDNAEAGNWSSVFGELHEEATAPHTLLNDAENPVGSDFTEGNGCEEYLNEFGGNAIKSPFQDGHYIYAVIPGSGSGTSSTSPILYVADLESPANFNKKLQP
ncbi:MAG: hypothetical protein OSB28_05155 [Flavobacteriales bacterium]|nr:hypothetical protein [Flavobacteriales bacterium]